MIQYTIVESVATSKGGRRCCDDDERLERDDDERDTANVWHPRRLANGSWRGLSSVATHAEPCNLLSANVHSTPTAASRAYDVPVHRPSLSLDSSVKWMKTQKKNSVFVFVFVFCLTKHFPNSKCEDIYDVPHLNELVAVSDYAYTAQQLTAEVNFVFCFKSRAQFTQTRTFRSSMFWRR